MDVAMIVERVRIMAERPNADAIRALLSTPDVEQLAILWHFAQACTDGDLVARVRGIPARPVDAIRLEETELDVQTLALVEEMGITTVAEAAAATEEQLLRKKGMSLFRLEELRAICRKHLSGGRAMKIEPPLAERVRDRIVRELRTGAPAKRVAASLRIPAYCVHQVQRELAARAVG